VTRLKFAASCTLAVALAGCSSIEPPPQPNEIRNQGATAPADLQLVCASEAATRLQINAANVFPISSTSAPGGFQVTLNTGNGQALCLIDENGAVQSVQRV